MFSLHGQALDWPEEADSTESSHVPALKDFPDQQRTLIGTHW